MAPAQAKQPPPPGSVSEPRVQGGQRSWLVWIRRRRRRDPSPLIGPPGSAGGSLPLAGRWRWELTPVGRGRACPALSLMESSSSLLFFQHHRSQHALHDADDPFFSSSRRASDPHLSCTPAAARRFRPPQFSCIVGSATSENYRKIKIVRAIIYTLLHT